MSGSGFDFNGHIYGATNKYNQEGVAGFTLNIEKAENFSNSALYASNASCYNLMNSKVETTTLNVNATGKVSADKDSSMTVESAHILGALETSGELDVAIFNIYAGFGADDAAGQVSLKNGSLTTVSRDLKIGTANRPDAKYNATATGADEKIAKLDLDNATLKFAAIFGEVPHFYVGSDSFAGLLTATASSIELGENQSVDFKVGTQGTVVLSGTSFTLLRNSAFSNFGAIMADNASTITVNGTITNSGTITMDYTSSLVAASLANSGSINITVDAAMLAAGTGKLIDLTDEAAQLDTANITVNGTAWDSAQKTFTDADGNTYTLVIQGNDLWKTDVSMGAIYVNADWPADTAFGREVAPGCRYGINVFSGLNQAIDEVAEPEKIVIAAGTYDESATQFVKGVEVASEKAVFSNVWSFGVKSDAGQDFDMKTAEKFTVTGYLTVGQFYAEKNANVYVKIDGNLTTVGSFGAKLATQVDVNGTVTVTPPQPFEDAQVLVYGTMNVTGKLNSTSGAMGAVLLVGLESYETEYGKGGVLNVSGADASVVLRNITGSNIPVKVSAMSSLNLSGGAAFVNENGGLQNLGTVNVDNATLTLSEALENSGTVNFSNTTSDFGTIANDGVVNFNGGNTVTGSITGSADGDVNFNGVLSFEAAAEGEPAVAVQKNGAELTLKAGRDVLAGSVEAEDVSVGSMTQGMISGVERLVLQGGSLSVEDLTVYAGSSVTMGVDSSFTFSGAVDIHAAGVAMNGTDAYIYGAGSFTVDLSGREEGKAYKLVTYTGTGAADFSFVTVDAGTVEFNNSLYLADVDRSTFYVRQDYTETSALEDGNIFGYNAFADLGTAVTSTVGATTIVLDGDLTGLWPSAGKSADAPVLSDDLIFTAKNGTASFAAAEPGTNYSYTKIAGNFTVGAGVTLNLDVADHDPRMSVGFLQVNNDEKDITLQVDGTLINGGGDFGVDAADAAHTVTIRVSETGRFLSMSSDNTSIRANSVLEVKGSGTADAKMSEVQFRMGSWGALGGKVTMTDTNVLAATYGGVSLTGDQEMTVTNSVFRVEHDTKGYLTIRSDKNVTFNSSDVLAGQIDVAGKTMNFNSSDIRIEASGFHQGIYNADGALTVADGAVVNLAGSTLKADVVENNGTVTVSGASTLSGALSGSGNLIFKDASLTDNNISGSQKVIFLEGENTLDGTAMDIAGYDYNFYVGNFGTGLESAGATLNIVNGSVVEYDGNGYIGGDGVAAVNVAGAGSSLVGGGAGGDLYLRGSGVLNISDGAQATFSYADLQGATTVTGQNSFFRTIGGRLLGTLAVTDGAEAQIKTVSGGFAINSTLTVHGGTLDLDANAITLSANGVLALDTAASVKFSGTIENAGKITVDLTGAAGSLYKLVDYLGTGAFGNYGTVELTGDASGYTWTVVEGDLWVDGTDKSTILINSKYAGEVGSAIVDRDGYFFGFNALMEYSTSIGADSAVEFTGGPYRFEDGFSFTGREFTVSGDTSFNKVTGGAVTVTGGTLSIDTVELTADVATLSGALLAFSGSGMADLANLVLTDLDTNTMANRTKYVLATGVKDDSFAVTLNGETYELNVRKDGLLVGVENGELYVQKTDDWFNKAGDSSLTVLPANGYVFGGSDMYEDTSRNERLKLEVVTTDSENAGARVYGGGLFRNDALFSGTQKCEVTVTSGGVGKGVFGGNQIESGSIGGMLISSVTINSADGSFGLIAGGHHVGGSGDLNSTGETSVTINNGSFKGVIVGGSVIANDASAKVMGDTTVTIAGGTFDKQIFGGGFVQNNGSLNQYGNTTVTISGGTFSSNIYGGHGASNQNTSSNAMLFGNTNITISGGIFNGNIYGGGFDRSKVLGDTHITFTGATGADFSVNGIIDGDASNARYWGNNSFVGGDRYLTFDAFSGEFGATLITNIDQMKVTGGSDVNLKNQLDLSEVSQWEFDFGSSLEGFAQNDLAGDSLVLSGWEDQLGDKGWTVMSGSSITGFGEMEVTNGSNLIFAWNADEQYYLGSIGDEQFKLSMEDGVMKLAKLA